MWGGANKGPWLIRGLPSAGLVWAHPCDYCLGLCLPLGSAVCVFCGCWGSLSSASWKQTGPSPVPTPSLIQKVRVLALISPLVHFVFSNSLPWTAIATKVNMSFWICMYAAWGANGRDLWACISSPVTCPKSVNGHALSSRIIALRKAAVCQQWHCTVAALYAQFYSICFKGL